MPDASLILLTIVVRRSVVRPRRAGHGTPWFFQSSKRWRDRAAINNTNKSQSNLRLDYLNIIIIIIIIMKIVHKVHKRAT